ncbi:hypothetical protein, partial [Mesorhizobium sp. M0040]|uniref:hypothetical protein n=1 Tax=Mesorhizobium sp. M0040 TaxID=2956855 RepID=UPI00333BD064
FFILSEDSQPARCSNIAATSQVATASAITSCSCIRRRADGRVSNPERQELTFGRRKCRPDVTQCGLSLRASLAGAALSRSEANGIFNGTLIYMENPTSSACQILEECHAKAHLHGDMYRRRNSR